MKNTKLPEFRAALATSPEAVTELSDDTLLRYLRGDFPKGLEWLIRHPSLLRALASDAEAMQQTTIREIRMVEEDVR